MSPHISQCNTESCLLCNSTGESPSAVALSPPITIFRPPEKLVLEIVSTGRYFFIQWRRNGQAYQTGDFQPNDEDFPHFVETYANEPTTLADAGLYQVIVFPRSGQISPEIVNLTVIEFGI